MGLFFNFRQLISSQIEERIGEGGGGGEGVREVVFVDTFSSLDTVSNKSEDLLYVVQDEKQLYHYDASTNSFVKDNLFDELEIDIDTFTKAEINDLLETKADAIHHHDERYEWTFDKNTAFNKNFGNGSDEVVEGNNPRLFSNAEKKGEIERLGVENGKITIDGVEIALGDGGGGSGDTVIHVFAAESDLPADLPIDSFAYVSETNHLYLKTSMDTNVNLVPIMAREEHESGVTVTSLNGEGWKAFDNQLTTHFVPLKGSPAWVEVDFGEKTEVTSYKIITNDTAYDPTDWDFQASDDGENWTTLQEVRNADFTTQYDYEEKTYTLDDAANYRFYRLFLYESLNGFRGNTSITEIELYGSSLWKNITKQSEEEADQSDTIEVKSALPAVGEEGQVIAVPEGGDLSFYRYEAAEGSVGVSLEDIKATEEYAKAGSMVPTDAQIEQMISDYSDAKSFLVMNDGYASDNRLVIVIVPKSVNVYEYNNSILLDNKGYRFIHTNSILDAAIPAFKEGEGYTTLANEKAYDWQKMKSKSSGEATGGSIKVVKSSELENPISAGEAVIVSDEKKVLFSKEAAGEGLPTFADYTKDSIVVSANGEYNDSMVAWKAFDDDDSTYWLHGDPGNVWLQIEYPEPVLIREYIVGGYNHTGTAYPPQLPKDFRLQGSNDGVAFMDLDVQTGITDWQPGDGTIGDRKRFALEGVSEKYKFVRLYIDANGGGADTMVATFDVIPTVYAWETAGFTKEEADALYASIGLNGVQIKTSDTLGTPEKIGELAVNVDDKSIYIGSTGQLKGLPKFTDYVQDGITISANDERSNFEAWKIKNDNYTSNYNSWRTSNAAMPKWITFDYGKPVVAMKYSLQNYDSSNYSMPITWAFQGSDDCETWVTLDERTDEPAWNAEEKREYEIKSPGNFRCYRLFITSIESKTNYMNIAEMDIFTADLVWKKANETNENENGKNETKQKSVAFLPAAAEPNEIMFLRNEDGSRSLYEYMPEIDEETSLIPALASNNDQGFTASASSEYTTSNHAAFRAFDAEGSTRFWQASESDNEPHIAIESPEPMSAAGITLKAANNSGFGGYMPISFAVEGSNDGVGFTTLLEAAGQTFADGESKTYAFETVGSFSMYRLRVIEKGQYLCIDDIKYHSATFAWQKMSIS